MELSPILYSLFWYWSATIPTLWKTTTIITVPKKPRPTDLNHYRPVALTSIIMTCLKLLLLHTILPIVNQQLDPLQFAYGNKRGTEDTVACLLHLLLQHLDPPGTFARILFVDFSSAFSTIKRYLMMGKLHQLSTPPHLIHLLHNFLSDRWQAVQLGTTSLAPTPIPEHCRVVCRACFITCFTPVTAPDPHPPPLTSNTLTTLPFLLFSQINILF